MARINVFGIGQASKSPYVTAKGMQNLYAETRPAGEKSKVVCYRTPGLATFTDTGAPNPFRGAYPFDKSNTAYAVLGNTFYQVGGTGTLTSLGTLLTFAGRVSIVDNGTQIMIVDGLYGYIYTLVDPQTISSITRVGTLATLTTALPHGLGTGMTVTISGALPAQYNGTFTITVTGAATFTYVMTSDPGASAAPAGSYVIASRFTGISDVDFPANPLTVAFLGGCFVINVASSSRFYVSDLYDGLAWDALNFANAETNPDAIVAVWASNGQLMLFGERSTEYWGLSGALDFPFSLISGTATEWGLAATWSVAKYDNSVACLIRNRMGQVMVAKIAGYLPQKISTPDLDSIINSYSTTSDASAYSYMLGGHAMYVISFPTAGYTWLYDGMTKMWSKLKSFGTTRHRAEFGFSYLTNTIVADYEYGILYILSDEYQTDSGMQIEAEIISETVASSDLDRLTVDKFRVDMEVGQGSVAVEYPQCGLSVSRDNGKTFGAEVLQDIGPIGNYGNTIDWTRYGTARNFVFKLRVSDPFQFCLVSACVNPED